MPDRLLAYTLIVDFINEMQDAAFEEHEKHHEKGRRHVEFAVGDQVLLWNGAPQHKLESRMDHLCFVLRKVSDTVYAVVSANAPSRTKHAMLVHVDRLQKVDMTRTSVRTALKARLSEGWGIVDRVLDHQITPAVTHEFEPIELDSRCLLRRSCCRTLRRRCI